MEIALSVLKYKRNESKAEYLNTANQIYIETLRFLTRLSNRYSRLVSGNVIQLAAEVLNHVEKANSIYPSDDERKKLRKAHLLEARASLMALDVHLTHCYELISLNPEGCFETANGKPVKQSNAKQKINNMAESLGCLIDKENTMITNLLKSDKKR